MARPIALKFAPQRLCNISPPPHPSFEIVGTLTNASDVQLSVLGLSYAIRTKDVVRVQPEQSFPISTLPAQLPPGGAAEIYMPVTFTRDVLDAIEARRTGGEMSLQITAHAVVAIMYPRQDGNRTITLTGETSRLAIDVQSPETGQNSFKISRDTWIGCLQAFKHSELEVFELPVMKLRSALPTEALDELAEAEKCFRGGDWRGTLTKARSAFEAVAKISAQTNSPKLAFTKLWTSLLPDPSDEAKRDALDELVGGVSGVLHLGRHVQYPVAQVGREEALLGLRCALAAFAFMGALAK